MDGSAPTHGIIQVSLKTVAAEGTVSFFAYILWLVNLKLNPVLCSQGEDSDPDQSCSQGGGEDSESDGKSVSLLWLI
jgi:hypothetical protein